MDIYNAAFDLTADALACFTGYPPRRELGPPDRLYRFGSIHQDTFEGSAILGSEWWVPQQTFSRITRTAHRTGKPIIDVARAMLAVAKPWNPDMDWLTIIELKRQVHAWIGPARAQRIAGPGSAILVGSFNQAYVPGLAPAEAFATRAPAFSAAAVIVYHGAPFD
jgi:hypothetical protein